MPSARLVCVVALGVAASCSSDEARTSAAVEAITVPSGFSDHVVTTAIDQPIALDFLPDGTLLVASRVGKVYVVENKNSNPAIATALDLTSKVCSNRERGLLGLAVDPAFASNKKVYVYYTFDKNSGGCPFSDPVGASVVNRVVRYDYDAATKTLKTPKILLDNILSNNGWHNAGDLEFGPDGYLYVAVGDSGADISGGATGWGNQNARRKSLLQGKVLRVVKDTGEPAPGNPWLTAANARRCGDPAATPQYPADSSKPCKETFAWGFRNPYRLAFKPGSSTLFVNDVGQNIGGDFEEIDTAVSGADYGWNKNQGPDVDAATTPPTHWYEIGMQVDGAACRCITGGTFVVNGSWSGTYDDSYLFSDYTCGVIFRIKQSNGAWNRTVFAKGLGGSSLVHLAFGPNPDGGQSLWYLSFNGNKIGRIDGPSGNAAPVAAVTASPISGPTPLTVSFDGSGSHDTNAGGSITKYKWSFGDGSAVVTTTSPTTSHTYTSAATVTATLTVEDNGSPVKTASATVTLYPGDLPPVVSITQPADDATFIVGAPMNLSASATDPEDGTLPAASIAWKVLKVHDDHTHPLASATGNNIPFVPDGPEDFEAASSSFVRIEVTATDSRGQQATDQVEIFPREVSITVKTEPAGLKVKVNGVAMTAPQTLGAWEGWTIPIDAATQELGGTTYELDHWSDGGAATHAITVPASAVTYTATFRPVTVTKINFQTPTATVPAGYLKDAGDAFGPRGNGYSYGWDVTNPLTRERNLLADKRYDTTILMEKAGAQYAWEVALPSGTYQVHLVAGDAAYFDGSYHITAEGQPFLDGTPTAANHFVEVTKNVVVSDGRLSLANGAGSVLSRVCFIEITPVTTTQINFQTPTAAVPAGYLEDDGAVFGPRGNGYSYGWNVTNPLTRERNLLADKRYDTTILMEKTGTQYSWELALASGTYRVHLVAGDAAYFDGSYHITAEGQPFLDGTPTAANHFVEVTANATVSDGRLSLGNGAGSVYSRVCFIEIAPAP